MIIKCEVATQTISVDVDEEWANIIIDLDRGEYNNDHTETRRHCSLDVYDVDGNYVASPSDIEAEYLDREDSERLHAAIEQLEPRQRQLINNYYFKHMGLEDIAETEGVSFQAISQAIHRAEKKLKKLLSDR